LKAEVRKLKMLVLAFRNNKDYFEVGCVYMSHAEPSISFPSWILLLGL